MKREEVEHILLKLAARPPLIRPSGTFSRCGGRRATRLALRECVAPRPRERERVAEGRVRVSYRAMIRAISSIVLFTSGVVL